MPKAYAYIRWSTATQQTGDSESRQLAELDRFEKSMGIPIVKRYRDSGRSAFRGDNSRRGEFRQLLDSISAGEIGPGDFLVVESIDRITRQRVLDGVQLLQDILKSGVKLYTTADQKTYSVEDPREDLQTLLMISVIAQRAHEESFMKSKRLSSSWAKRRNEAETGKVIIKKGKSIPYGLRYEQGNFVIHPEEQQEVEKLFKLLLSHGLNTAIKMMNVDSRKKWNNGTVNKLIKNRTVIGFMPMHRVVHGADGKSRKIQTGSIENYYPKIIENSLFYRALNAMKSRKIEGYSGRRGEQDYNIFKHVIFCSECGGKLYYDHRGSRYKDKIYPYFKCDNNRTNPTICGADNLRFEHVLGLALLAFRNAEKITHELSSFALSGQSTLLVESLSDLSQKEAKDRHAFTEKLQELGEAESKLDSLSRQVEQLDFDVPKLVLKKLSDLEKQVGNLRQEIERLAVTDASVDVDVSSQESIMTMFMTEDGRAKLNGYFKSNHLSFYAGFDKSDRTGTIELRKATIDGAHTIVQARIQFPQKNILASFGLLSLQEMFDLRTVDCI